MKLGPPKKKPIFFNMFASLVLCIVVVVAILSTLFYVNIENILSDQISMANMKSLTQIKAQVNSMANMASTISYQIYNDVAVSKLLNYATLDISAVMPAMNQITNYLSIFPMIDSIYVYNGKTDTFYVRSNNSITNYGQHKATFYDRQVVDIIENQKDFRSIMPIARTLVDADGNVQFLYYTFIMCNNLTSKNNEVIVNINESYIQSIIDTDQSNGDSDSFIMDRNGIIVSNSTDYPILSNVSGNDYFRQIVSDSSQSGFFVSDVGGVKSIIVFTAPDSNGWTYVRVFKWDAIFSTITRLKIIIIGFSLAILVLGVLSAFILSRQLYRPINRLISSLDILEAEKQDNSFLMKQELLRDMIMGSALEKRHALLKRYIESGAKLPAESPLYAALLMIDRYKEFQQINSFEERSALKNAILLIALEKLSESTRMEAVDIGEDALVLILESAGVEESKSEEILSGRLAALQSEINGRLQLSVSIAASSAGVGIEALHTLYGQAAKTMQHRLFFGHGCLLFARSIMAYSSSGYVYPLQKEKLLIDALMDNKMEDVKRLYYEIVTETACYPISVFNLTISHLIFTLNNTINIITTNNSISNGFDVGIPVGLLSEVETIDEFNDNIYRLFDKLSRSLEEKKTLKHEMIVNTINEIIQARYSASDLSIGSIASTLNMSDAYICRVYKQLTLRTILETIVNIRMQRARELLKDSNCAITKIAEKCGFTSSTYFYTAFKAANGVTPSDYRKNIQA
jgi:two-component system, response regulator YesN